MGKFLKNFLDPKRNANGMSVNTPLLDQLGLNGHASGGPVTGVGTGSSDSIVARLSNGEHVLTASDVRKMGGQHAVERFRRLVQADRLPKFAAGGPVGTAARPVTRRQAAPPVAVPTSGIVPALTSQARSLAEQGLEPLAREIKSSTVPALQAAERQASRTATVGIRKLTNALPALGATNSATGTQLRATWTANAARLTAASSQMVRSQRNWQAQNGASWRAINATVSGTTKTLTGRHFASVRTGLTAVRSAMSQTAAWAWIKFREIYRASAQPTRQMISGPLNRGITLAWNSLNKQFALGKRINPIPLQFAAGGKVPGVGNGDTVPALLTPGEYVVPKQVVRHWGLDNIRRAHHATLQNAGSAGLEGMFNGDFDRLQRVQRYAKGGIVADTGSAANAAVLRGLKWAKKQDGKPYVWGASGPNGYDCSGLQSALTRTLRNESNPYRRIGVARSQPWPGFVRGLNKRYSTGFSNVHTSGTLAGINIESTGNHVRFGKDAHGANDRQFPGHASLPFVGGRFVPGGPGSFDAAPIVSDAFGETYRMIAGLRKRFAGNYAAIQDAKIATKAADAIKGKALNKISSSLSVTSGVAGSPEVVAAVKAVATQFGWGDGPQWEAIKWIVSHESGWNPAARNPTTSASGLFQKMTSLHGPLEPTVAGQARWGLNYMRGRYGSPLAAKAFWEAHHSYDQGGIARGKGVMPKNTLQPERVLSPQMTKTFDEFMSAIFTRRGVFRPGGTAHASGMHRQAIGDVTINAGQRAGADEIARALRHQARTMLQAST